MFTDPTKQKTGVMSEGLRRRLEKYKHECETCGKLFIRPDDYKKHMRCHTGEKPYTCLKCGQRFQLKGGLNKHMKKQHVDQMTTKLL